MRRFGVPPSLPDYVWQLAEVPSATAACVVQADTAIQAHHSFTGPTNNTQTGVPHGNVASVSVEPPQTARGNLSVVGLRPTT